MISLEPDTLLPKSDNDQSGHGCFKNRICRNFMCCHECKYTSNTNLIVKLCCATTALLSIGTIMMGVIWRDSMEDNQEEIVIAAGFAGVIGSGLGAIINDVVNDRIFNQRAT